MEVVALLRKTPKMESVINLLLKDFKTLSKLLMKKYALIVGSLIEKTQTGAISIHDNIHIMRYSIKSTGIKFSFGVALFHLD